MRKNLIPIMTSNNLPNGEAFGSSKWTSSSEYFYAFNDNTTQNFTSNSTLPQYIGYKSTRAYKVVCYSVSSRNLNVDDLSIAPTEWELQGSNDNSVWETIDTRLGVLWSSKLEEKVFEIENLKSFFYYRLNVKKNNGYATSIFGINRIQLFYEGEKIVINNPTKMHYYSLSDNTLIHLPNSSPKNMILHGIEQGKEIQLDVPFSKHKYVNETPITNASGKVFTQDIGRINTLNIKEIKENTFEPIYTWFETKMTSNTTPSPFVVSSSSNFNATYEAWKAFNGTLTNLEDCWVTADGITNGWIQINYNIPKKLNFVRISPRDYIDFNSSSPKNFNILGSNNGVDFDLLAEVRGQNDWKQNTPKDFAFSNENNYSIYRLEALDNNGSTGIAVGEILYGYKKEVN